MKKLIVIGILALGLVLSGCVSITANYKMSSDYNKKVSGPRPEINDQRTDNKKLIDASTDTEVQISKSEGSR